MEKTGRKIIIAERDNIAAVVEQGKVQEFFVHRGDVLLGDVYLATVENILPSIEAAFVNVGVDKMGFLHAQDVIGKGALKDKLSPKQKLVVQVTKEPTGHKGPRVTTEISLPGRFLVLIPNETGINVSRKIESVKEKARLKSVVNLLKPVGVGVIVRTEAEGQSEADIQEDLEILLEKWNNIVTSADSLTPPSLLYRDQDLLYRVLREACTDDVTEILVDTAFAMNRVQQVLQNWHMSRNIEVNLYKGTEPLLIATDIHKEIKAALQSKVNLPSGGYLYVQTTEALTVIDVNSGKFTSSATQDETILKTNKEAVQEIARQLRLRNIGGMIIVDFIDMNSRVDKLTILEEFELALEPDKSKPQIGQLSDLGLVELTRHRQGQSISELFAKKCPHCQGNGYIMEDFKFASPTAEGEYRAKAAKLKLPVSNFNKKPNQNNQQNYQNQQNQNQPQTENQQVKEQTDFEGENVQQQSPDNRDNRDNRNKNRKNKFNKNKNRDRFNPKNPNPENQQNEGFGQEHEANAPSPDATAQPVSPIQTTAPTTPIVVEQREEAPKPVQQVETKKEEAPVQEIKEQAPQKEEVAKDEAKAEEKPKKRGRKPAAPRKPKATKQEEVKNEESVENN